LQNFYLSFEVVLLPAGVLSELFQGFQALFC
jgi:hypothetical protein